MPRRPSLRKLVVVLGDQLDPHSAALQDFDPRQDALWMAEVSGEATYVWTSKARLVLFLSAMRHFREAARARGWTVHYRELEQANALPSLGESLAADLTHFRPQSVCWVEAGEYRVEEELRHVVNAAGLPWQALPDAHFLASREEFFAHAQGRKQLRMEFFYREMRRKHRVLLTPEGTPEGGDWNYDAENRHAFDRNGPGPLPAPQRFLPDALTQEVITRVSQSFATHPGSTDEFDWPVTPEEAASAWQDFLLHRLPHFGRYQDAMWVGEPWLYHARVAAAMNLKLLSPLRLLRDVEHAYRQGQVELASAEGFIRQILGWREYVRGVYWLHMPGYLERNALQARAALPDFFWTGATDLLCLQEVIGQTLRHGYAHHIQRLMVTGLFCLLLGVDPKQVHGWYLAVYVDAVEWVELPNTLGMSQYADGGIMASKPYIATGKYLQRMSNYCAGCRYDPAEATGPAACPFTTLYWDFLLRHQALLAHNPRMALQVRNVEQLTPRQREAIQHEAQALRQRWAPASPSA